MDLIPSIDSDAEVDFAASEEEEVFVPPRKGRGAFSDLANDSDSADNDDDNAKGGKQAKNATSWSFKSAIAKIDASHQPLKTKLTTLQEKINSVVKSRAKSAEKPVFEKAEPVSGKKRKQLKSAEQLYDDEGFEDDSENEDADAEIEDEDAANADSEVEEGDEGDEDDEDDEDEDEDDGSAASDSDNDSGDHNQDEDDDDDDGADAASDDEGVAAAGAGFREGARDAVADMIASAKPNPFKQRSGQNEAAIDKMTEEYAGYFAPDPFAAAAQDTIKSKAAAKRSRALMEASAAGDFAEVSVTGLAEGTALKEPKSFSEMNLSRPLLRAVTELGYTNPTPIQRRCVPLALAGHDICGSAVTGSGKTAAYLLPILERLLYKPARIAAIRVLILTPTRELATQVHSMCQQLGKHCPDIRAALVVGGLALKPQEAELRARPDIVIATPGRMLDHIRNTLAVHCEDVDVLILDEADRLLEMGFENEVSEIVKACPVGRQTMLFSATMTAKVDTLAKLSLRKPVRVVADPLYDMAHRLSQEFIRIKPGKEGDREAILMSLVTRSFIGGGVLVFAVHKQTAHRLAILFGLAGLKVAELHGNLSQRQRLAALEDFRENRVDYLVATDLAGRGLDIAGVRAVINFEMPKELTAYVHRVGRTARAGRSGVAVTLVNENQRSMMKEIVKRATLNVKSRIVASDAIAAWRDKLSSWSGDIRAVLDAERVERAMRIAEVEANKAENLIEHHDEIMSRPARTWFMSEREKDEVRKEAADRLSGVKAAAKTPESEESAKEKAKKKKEKDEKRIHNLSRKKRRRLDAQAEDAKEERKVRRAEEQLAKETAAAARNGRERGGSDDEGHAPRLDPEIARAKRELELTAAARRPSLAKGAKAEVRGKALQLGVTPGMARRILDREKKGKGKRKPAADTNKPASRSSFAADLKDSKSSFKSGFGAEKKSRGSASDDVRATKGAKRLPNHKPGTKSFKSSKKFKRR